MDSPTGPAPKPAPSRWLAAAFLVAAACLGLEPPAATAQPSISFNPLPGAVLSPGQPFDFVIRIDQGPTGQILNGSISFDGADVTGPFVAAIQSGVVQTITSGRIILLTVPQVSLPLGQHQVVVNITSSTGTGIGQWSATVQPSTTILSPDQQSLVASRGNPDYVTIVFNTAPLRREETWKYASIRKIYTFHDGARVDETTEPSMPSIPRNPPRLDPAAFTRNMTVNSLTQTYGPLSKVENQSKPAFTMLMYHFRTRGLMAGFVDNILFLIDTVDLP